MPEPASPAAATAAPLVALQGIEKHFGDVVAVRGLDLEIEAGTFVAIMGPSGCGKSTTLRLLAGLERPTQGRIMHRGQDITHGRPWRRGMPMVWQSLALFPFLNVLENVAFGLKMAGVGRRERYSKTQEWLARFGLEQLAARDVSVLSGGQLQRVALARALITEPDVLLLDEPLSALDAHLVVRMQAELARLQRELGITFVYVTHSQSEALAMADRVIIMNNGAIQQRGTPREVYDRPANRFVAEFVGTNNLLPGTVERADGRRLRISTKVGGFESEAEGNRAFDVGDSVYLVVSADRIRLRVVGSAGADGRTDSPDGAANRLSGRFVSEQFIGAVVTLYLDVGQQSDLRVQLLQRDWDQLRREQSGSLQAEWSAADCFTVGA